MSRRGILAAALLLPLLVLAGSWAATYRMAQQGVEWLVPIEGYDPRDLLRGHYVQYRHAWPGGMGYGSALCIEGRAPDIRAVRPLAGDGAGRGAGEGCAAVARAQAGARREVRGLETGIYYASQARALTLSRQLADTRLQGYVRVKIRPDGVMRPVALEFRPRATAPKGAPARP